MDVFRQLCGRAVATDSSDSEEDVESCRWFSALGVSRGLLIVLPVVALELVSFFKTPPYESIGGSANFADVRMRD